MAETGSDQLRPLEAPSAGAPARRAHAYVRVKGRRRLIGWALLGMLALGTVAVAVFYRAYRLRTGRTEPAVQSAEPLPENAKRATAGYIVTRSEGGHPVFTIRAERSVDFQGGTILEGVEVEIFGRAGDQHDLLKTKRCEYNAPSGNFTCAGQVEIELNAALERSRPQTLPDASSASPTVHGRQPVYLETSGLTYNHQQSLASTSAPVRWRYGPASGSAVGLVYAIRKGSVELEHNVTASWPAQERSNQAHEARAVSSPTVLQLAAVRLHYSKALQQLDLAGPVQLTEGARQLDSGRATLYLDARNRLSRARLDQGVRAADSPAPGSSLRAQAVAVQAEFDPETGDLKSLEASGAVQAQSQRSPSSASTRLDADRVQVSFTGAHFHPVNGEASGHVHLSAESAPRHQSSAATDQPDRLSGGQSVPGPAASPSAGSLARQSLDADAMQFFFRPADGTLERSQTVGPGKLVLVPSSPRTGNRVVTAGQFLMTFDSRSRLEDVHGSRPTKIVFEPAPGSPEGTPAAESQADRLEAKLDPATGALQSIQQAGQFQFFNGDQRATANQADYSADSQALTLTGKPALADPGSLIRADRFVVQVAANVAQGLGHVSSAHCGPLKEASGTAPEPLSNGEGAKGPRRGTAVSGAANPMGSSDTTNVVADRVTADRTSQYVRYEGHVRAWHGTDVVESPALDIYRADRRIVSGSGVVTSGLAPARTATYPATVHAGRTIDAGRHGGANSGSDPAAATEPVTIRADHLEYFDLERKAAYRGHVRLDASDATLQADRLDAYFSPAGAGPGRAGEATKLQRAVADGNVTVVEPGRRAAGDHAEYFAAEGKVVMTGGPPTLYDAKAGFTTGQTLTFFTAGDSLMVDGGNGSRTLSKHKLEQ